jgi:predicted  nucleic acid-binding Zn-ribbon protein
VPPEEYALFQEQAKAYRANQSEIINIRESWREIEEEKHRQKELNAKKQEQLQRWEKSIKFTEKQAEDYHKEAVQLWDMATMPDTFQKQYNYMERQIAEYEPIIEDLQTKLRDSVPRAEHTTALWNFHELCTRSQALERNLSRTSAELEVVKKSNDTLNATVIAQNKTITSLKESLRFAFESFINAIKAVGMLKYDKGGDYEVKSLTPKQDRLIDSVADYAAHWAKREGFPELAKDVQEKVEISKGVQDKINERTPRARTYFQSR